MTDRIAPADLATIGDLELAARLIAEGYLFGRHHGRRLGSGIEFAQYRAWEPGESVARIDWRLFARTEKLFVREAELETEFRLWLMLDHSASMAHRSPDAALSKFQYARYLLAAFGYLAQQQDDELALIGVGEDSRILLPPSSGRKHWYRLLASLENLEPGGRVDATDHLPANLIEATQGSLVVAVSDFYEHHDEWLSLLERLSWGNREVLAICLESEAEIGLDYDGVVEFQDLESGRTVLTSPEEVNRVYQRRREAYLAGLAERCQRGGIQFARFNVDLPMDRALRVLLDQRARAA